MELRASLKGAHEHRLAEVRGLTSAALPPTQGEPPAERLDMEEGLRVAMVRLLPRAGASDEACARLLTGLTPLWWLATRDLRALDAWHNGYEAAIDRGLDADSPAFRAFLSQYAALLESWVASKS